MSRGPSDGGAPARFAPLRGVLLLARGRAEGMALFRATPEGFLASLAPLLVVPLAGSLLLLLDGWVAPALALVLVALTVQLSPAVLSHALARRWGREAGWLRYATAYNWCQWAVLGFMFLVLAVLGVMTGAAPSDVVGSRGFTYAVGLYAIWLHWVVTRHGLDLGGWRAALLVVLVSLGVVAMVVGPTVLQVLLFDMGEGG